MAKLSKAERLERKQKREAKAARRLQRISGSMSGYAERNARADSVNSRSVFCRVKRRNAEAHADEYNPSAKLKRKRVDGVDVLRGSSEHDEPTGSYSRKSCRQKRTACSVEGALLPNKRKVMTGKGEVYHAPAKRDEV